MSATLSATTPPSTAARRPLAHALVAQLRRRGHEADSIALPPRRNLWRLNDACAWRLLNLASSNARRIDLVIATGFPRGVRATRGRWPGSCTTTRWPRTTGTTAARARTDAGRGVRQRLVELDTRALTECRRVFAGGTSTAERPGAGAASRRVCWRRLRLTPVARRATPLARSPPGTASSGSCLADPSSVSIDPAMNEAASIGGVVATARRCDVARSWSLTMGRRTDGRAPKRRAPP
jgi:hypothetical protein